MNNKYTMYSGITLDSYNKYWKDKNLNPKKNTNVTSDKHFAFDYSYNFKIGEYENLIIEISNIPLDAFIGYRDEDYADDSDWVDMPSAINSKKNIIDNYELFLLDLYPFKEEISIKLIKK